MTPFLKKPLDVPDASAAATIGLNVWALKLIAESWPTAVASLKRMGLVEQNDAEVSLCLVLTAKDGTRVKLTLAATEEKPTLGDGAL